MNDYMNGYEGIQNKQDENVIDPKYFENDLLARPSFKKPTKKVSKKPVGPADKGKKVVAKKP